MSDISSVPSRATSPVSATPDQLPTARPYRFTWDPASRRPGPESVSGTTEGRGGDDFGGTPHPLGFLNHSTTSLALGSLPSEWSSSRTGFHAISTVLNNPHKRQAPPKAHSLLPPVPPADLPRVRRKDFESYLKAITPEWERYEHNSQLGRDGQAQIDDNQWTPRNSIAGEEPPTPSRTASISLQGKYIPPLDSVPEVFFHKDFNLGDPRTFANVTEQDAAAALLTPQDDTFADPFSLSHSLPLLEKFSHYADTVEQHLVREISIRSTSFFAALTNLHDLQSESERCLNRIGKLRTQLQNVDNNSAKRGLDMVRKECKMANLGKVRDGVKMISGVVEMTGVAKGLVNAGQWGEALGVIEELEKLWEVSVPEPDSAAVDGPPLKGSLGGLQNGNGNGHVPSLSPLPPTPEEDLESAEQPAGQQEIQINKTPPISHPVPLSSLHAFSALPSHLRTLTMEIAASLSSELVSVLRSDLELRINSDGKPNADADQGLRDRLKPLLLNLVRTKGLKEGVLSWREVVLVEVRRVVKKILPAFDPDEEEASRESSQSEGRAGLANHLRTMSHPDFVLLIQKVYRALLNGVEGLQAQGTIVVEVLSALGSQLQQKVTDIAALEEDLADIVSSSAELANTQAAKVISYRAEQHAALELADFLTFFNDSWAFVIKCETISRRMIVGLRGTVVGQAKLFLQSFHQARISRSAKLVEDELWNPAEITPGLQHITNIIIDSAVRDPPDLIIKSDETIFSPVATDFPTPAPNATSAMAQSFATAMLGSKSANGSSSAGAASTKHLHIEERSYYVVSATAEVLTLLLDYLRVVVNLSMLTTDIMSRVIEFLKSFNSRTCQVVLGAGAMRSAGLKNITAKHLALASQSLSIIFELIPYVRETFRRHLSQKQAVMLVEFDKLKRDYQEHQNEIHAKLVAIMGDRLNAHIKSLKTVDWSVPKPGGGVNDYMEILVKETVTLHKVLSRYLAPPVVEYVMTQVFAAINHRLSEEYGAIELPHQEAKTRLLADAKYLHQKFATLKNVGAPTAMLETVIADKPIPRTGSNSNAHSGPSGPPAPPTRSNTLTANQRLKGLLSSRASTFMHHSAPDKDKALPLPTRTPSPPPVPPPTDKPRSPIPSHSQLSIANDSLYGSNLSQDQFTNDSSQVSLSMSVSPVPEAGGTQGFKQVEIPPSPNPDSGPAPTTDNPK
ncbi:Vps54-like protein-domain-containing protein [Flammula alnicola]|nr:Vps54-like protein-domain-containing protein [Flammula alnicola]